MSVRQIQTSYKYFGSSKNHILVINDDLATAIRGGQTSSITIRNIETVSDFFSTIEQYVGDISNIDFPVGSVFESSYPDFIDRLSQIFSNIYYVEGLTGNTFLDDYFEYSGVTCDGACSVNYVATEQTSSVSFLSKFTTASSNYNSPLYTNYSFRIDPRNQYFVVGVRLPIFKESDFVDGKLKTFTTSERFSHIIIQWGGNTAHDVVIMKYNESISSSSVSEFNLFANTEIPNPPPPPPTDPYDPSHGGPGYSVPGGGPSPSGGTGATGTGGLHDDTSDPIPTPSLPSSIATGSGLFTAYNPDVSQLADFASNLWNADVTLMGGDLFKLLFGGDAFNAIIGLHLLPVQPTTSASPINIKLGNWDTGASAPKIINQYVQVPFGSLMLPEYWGNSIDYSPYTRIQLALPYIGIVDVDTDDVLGSNNTLTYNIDVLSGALCATLHCVKGNLSSVIYQWSGSCGVSLPVTGASFNAVMGAIMGIGAAVAGGIALASGPIGAAIGTAGVGIASTVMGVGAAGNMYGSVKGKVQKSGAFGANSGALGIMTPYFIVTRPVQSVPETWQADKGYPSNISAQLGTVTGYTEVSEINLECSGTEAEKKEIIDLLKKGVLF